MRIPCPTDIPGCQNVKPPIPQQGDEAAKIGYPHIIQHSDYRIFFLQRLQKQEPQRFQSAGKDLPSTVALMPAWKVSQIRSRCGTQQISAPLIHAFSNIAASGIIHPHSH